MAFVAGTVGGGYIASATAYEETAYEDSIHVYSMQR